MAKPRNRSATRKDWNITTEVRENRLKRTSQEALSRTTGEAGKLVRNDNDDRKRKAEGKLNKTLIAVRR